MRKTLLRRLEALEKEDRAREQKELSSLQEARACIWIIVLAYYLGGLKSDEEEGSPWKIDKEDEAAIHVLRVERLFAAHARALKCDYLRAREKDVSEVLERFHDAHSRLFATVGLDFDSAPPSVLFDALVTMVDQLPDQWLNWLRSHLQDCCSNAEIAPGSNLPRWLSADNFFTFSKPSGV